MRGRVFIGNSYRRHAVCLQVMLNLVIIGPMTAIALLARVLICRDGWSATWLRNVASSARSAACLRTIVTSGSELLNVYLTVRPQHHDFRKLTGGEQILHLLCELPLCLCY